MPNRISGANEAASEIGRSLEEIPSLLRDAVNKRAEKAKAAVIDGISSQYNLGAPELERYVTLRRASTAAISASVEFQIKAVPLEQFRPEIRMQSLQIRSRSGRSFTRMLPTVYVSLYKSSPRKLLPAAFPLRQRADGILAQGDGIRRRIGAGRDRLTRFRYFTFPKKLFDPILAALSQDNGDDFSISVRVAFRNSLGQLSSRG